MATTADGVDSRLVVGAPRREARVKWAGVVLVLGATFGLALKGIWARLAYDAGLSVSGVLFYRSALSAPLVVASAWWLISREATQRTPGVSARRYSVRDYAPGAALGAMFSVGMVCDFQAIAQLGAGVSRVVLFGFPLVVMLLEAARTRSLPELRKVGGFLVAWVGLAFVAQRSSVGTGGPVNLGALTWGLASMSLYALYVWLSGGVTRRLGSARLTGVSNLTTAAVVVLVVLALGGGAPPLASWASLRWVGVMVVVSTVVPYFMLMEGIERLGAPEASLLAMTGPLVTVFFGWLVLNEQLSVLQLLGTGATLFGVLLARSSPALGRP